MNERISKILNHPNRGPVMIGVASFGAGVVAGYIFGRGHLIKQARKEAEKLAEHNRAMKEEFSPEELEFLKQLKYEQAGESVLADELPQPETPTLADDIAEEAEAFDGPAEKVVVEENALDPDERDGPARPEIFNYVSDEEWDFDVEIPERSTEAPYILHKDEFFDDTEGYTQKTLTYYSEDDIMCDEDDRPVYNYTTVVGKLQFGYGSGGDMKAFYVRNDKRREEYEVMYDPGMYSRDVMGLEIEENARVNDVKHSSRPTKFKKD